jgi:hypothetical protein
MLGRIFRRNEVSINIATSRLFDSNTFYSAFEKDLYYCRSEAVIESPFMTLRRVSSLVPAIRKAVARGVTITINTKPPQEHDEFMRLEAEASLVKLQNVGVNILFTGGHHRKLAIFDREILWEGSLNILSQNGSCEIMKRTVSQTHAQQMIDFIKIEKFL